MIAMVNDVYLTARVTSNRPTVNVRRPGRNRSMTRADYLNPQGFDLGLRVGAPATLLTCLREAKGSLPAPAARISLGI